MLIQLQKPEATRVAGYKTWTQVGRQVRKGETGITILAPVIRKSAPKEPEATESTIAQPEQASPEPTSDKLRDQDFAGSNQQLWYPNTCPIP